MASVSDLREQERQIIVAQSDAYQRAVAIIKDIVGAYDSHNLEMRSPEIGEPENGIPMHEWHEGWLHNAREFLKG